VRVLIVDTYYAAFVAARYARDDLARRPYQEQIAALMAERFGTADAYSHHLRQIGHEGTEVVANCEPLQRAWARERGRARGAAALARALPGRFGGRLQRSALHEVLAAQVEAYDPDVVYVQNMGFHATAQIEELRGGGRRLVVGQIASPAPPERHLRAFDLIVTSFPHFAERFRALGIDSEYLPLAFDERLHDVTDASPDGARPYPVTFIGGVNPAMHAAGTEVLERLARRMPIEFWGYGAEALPRGSKIRENHHGEAWGLDMYRVLGSSKIVVNRHIDVAEGYANNMRLYEATGMGALLMTDRGHNLADLFKPGSEVVVYEDADDLAEKIARHLADDDARGRVASAGQDRTLREHTYARRIPQLAKILEDRLRRRNAWRS
jgi:spore maturation protein CgeB